MAGIKLRNINKIYGNSFHALHDLSFDIRDGEFMVFVGPSGCGKSTALRMIAGLENISGGELKIGDRVVNNVDPKDRDIAMVFQSYALYPHKTVRENVAFPLLMARLPKAEIDSRVNEAARILELTTLLDRKPALLSGGQRQRVAMGRAIVRKPAAFLMDEPLSNLDAKLRVQMRAEIASLQRKLNVTTIYVTHDQVEAMTMGDRVAVMKSGVLQQVDTPQNLYNRPDNVFVAAFIGSPSMNLYEAVLNGRTLTLGNNSFEIPDRVFEYRPSLNGASNRQVIVGIRPEHMNDAAIRPSSAEISAPGHSSRGAGF
ncbi:UNVERIFIED_ORG: multiple sugar transport system ATP-binding protein [Rhizobium etli]